MNDRPVLRRQNAPDHRPGFWDDLEAAMAEPIEPTATIEATARAGEGQGRSRSVWPLVAAAAVLALAGLGMLFVRGGADPGTEVVSVSDPDLAVADAPPENGQGDEADAASDAQPIPTAVVEPSGDDASEPATPQAVPVGSADEPTPIDIDSLDVPTYVTAAGNSDALMFPPSEPFADGTRFLGTWESERLSWFSLGDIDADCTRPDHSHLKYVTAEGFALEVSDPAARFSGNASNLAHTDTHIAWVTECQGRLALYVASHSGVPGQLFGVRMAWLGKGSDTAASVRWDGSVVTLNSINAGTPFFVDVDMASGVVSGSAVLTDVGPGTGRDSWIVGATPDGSTTWWNVTQSVASSSCDGRTLMRLTEPGGWESPFVDPVDVGAVEALAVNPDLAMVAFADACPGINEGRLFIGTLRADGLISSVREIDLSAFASGSVFDLDWTDPLTLRIHTDESVTGGFPLRFEYVFDDGRDAGVLVLLD